MGRKPLQGYCNLLSSECFQLHNITFEGYQLTKFEIALGVQQLDFVTDQLLCLGSSTSDLQHIDTYVLLSTNLTSLVLEDTYMYTS